MTAELITRLESADGPDRELDWAIAESLGWTRRQVGQVIAHYAQGDPHMKAGAPRYTASIDAALTLVPGSDEHTSVFWQLANDGAGGNPADFLARLLICTNLTSHQFRAVASTPALALAAAALKARGV